LDPITLLTGKGGKVIKIAVIPALNEAKAIKEVILHARKYVDYVLVSDGNSIDDTAEIARLAGAKVIVAGPNFITGYGACIRQGVEWVLEHENADIIVLLDADGQHDPEDIPSLLAPVLADEADVVLGCRVTGNMPGYRRFGNKVLTSVCNIGHRFKPPDAVTGYWVIATKAMPKLTERQWGMAVELLIKTRNKWRMKVVPVKAIYHENYADNSTVSPIRLGFSLLWYIIKWRIKIEMVGEKC